MCWKNSFFTDLEHSLFRGCLLEREGGMFALLCASTQVGQSLAIRQTDYLLCPVARRGFKWYI